jgi:hypothetical protein
MTSPSALKKALLAGERPLRPLLLPAIFSLGARLQNVALPEYQSNPTKIANALRQISGTLKADGLSCCPGMLEAEAIGCEREWWLDGSCLLKPPTETWVGRLAAFEQLSQARPLATTCEVLRRLKAMLKDGPALTAQVTGPATLRSQLLNGAAEAGTPPADEILECCARLTEMTAKLFAEAGADIILVKESVLPEFSAQKFSRWRALLEPVINVIRFYEVLPVLVLDEAAGWQQWLPVTLGAGMNCVISLPIQLLSSGLFAADTGTSAGVHLPSDFVTGFPNAPDILAESASLPVAVLTSEELPLSTDLKRLSAWLAQWRECPGS